MLSLRTSLLSQLRASLPGRPRSVLSALLQLLPAKVVLDAARSVSDSTQLIEILAERQQLDRIKLLEFVAAKLKCQAKAKLEIPTRELLFATGETLESLKRLAVVPQEIPGTSLTLVAADTTLPELSKFRRKNIPILLGLRREISRAWEKYEILTVALEESSSETFLPPILRSVVLKLAADCRQLGAHEVFLGHPRRNTYECLADDKIYTGSVHPDVFDGVLQVLRAKGGFILNHDRHEAPPVHISLTRNFEELVICITWGISEPTTRKPMVLTASTCSSTANAIPAKPEPLLDRTPEPQQSKLTASTGRLLLVDDDERFGTLLKGILEAKGYQVDRCLNGQQALLHIEGACLPPAVVVCDVHMPHVDGRAFVRKLREAGLNCPVLMLTSEEDRLIEAELALLGADAYVQKREDPRVLLAWIKNLSSRAKRLAEHR